MVERIVAVLHDVVEDSEWTLDGLAADGFSEEVISAIDAVSRREGEPYMEFVGRAGAHPLGARHQGVQRGRALRAIGA